ncbi:MAG TPA: hypothetical protein VER39_05125 [Nocardioidaceae bacterium]|nr:hypothetical protein [Nocardioidaceae bacterium]
MSAPHGALAGLSSDELRAAVRAVLRDVLPSEVADPTRAPGSVPGAALAGEVVVQSDADLGVLLRRIASLCDDPAARAALKDGRHGFRLAAGASRSGQPTGAATVRVERGAVTERAVAKAAADGARLVLGPKAVLTPLARDKARVLGVEIEKER